MTTFFAYILLLYNTITNAAMAPWILAIQADNYLRLSWRYFLFSFMMIPFILYEQRTGD